MGQEEKCKSETVKLYFLKKNMKYMTLPESPLMCRAMTHGSQPRIELRCDVKAESQAL